MAANVVNLLTFIKQLNGEEKWRKLSTEDGGRSQMRDRNMLTMYSQDGRNLFTLCSEYQRLRAKRKKVSSVL
jgi:hypothetical protein